MAGVNEIGGARVRLVLERLGFCTEGFDSAGATGRLDHFG